MLRNFVWIASILAAPVFRAEKLANPSLRASNDHFDEHCSLHERLTNRPPAPSGFILRNLATENKMT
jgi:hypothetical protein